ncbi:MAG: uroporphyrinogen-III C-methyltransferase, partial [Vogesella sp.]|uniref:uroporphyrinogen-III C-methyltransferase n=1 Tax=Vogesella sp. TaxID=1904252 RepID=UPI003F386794
RENIKLRLLDARLALPQRDGATYQADLAAAAQYGARYFDRDAPATQKWQATLAELAAARLNVTLPDLSASLKAVRDAQGNTVE